MRVGFHASRTLQGKDACLLVVIGSCFSVIVIAMVPWLDGLATLEGKGLDGGVSFCAEVSGRLDAFCRSASDL